MRYEDVPWEAAACKGTDPEAFYPEKGVSVSIVARICPTCPILSECAAYAIRNEVFGYWGGMSENVRLDIRAGRRKRAA
jgi:WhiB family redox-sensing transcriptional regulator